MAEKKKAVRVKVKGYTATRYKSDKPAKAKRPTKSRTAAKRGTAKAKPAKRRASGVQVSLF